MVSRKIFKRFGILLFIFSCSLLISVPIDALAHGDEHGELIIRMTNNGFEPKELTVTEGDEIIFINNDDTNRWPASNFHPTHTLDPEFDPKKGISPGESWPHVFNKTGTWRMHDHLNPHMTGTIVVLEDPDAQGRTLDIDSQGPTLRENVGFWARLKIFFWKLFHKTPPQASSQFQGLEDLSERDGPEAAWDYLLETYNTPEGVVGNPHDMAHLVGQLLFKEQGFDGLSICTPVFAFGCYHGLMEVAFDKYKDERSDTNYKKGLLEAREGCVNVGSTTSPTYWSCIHGIGHGIATFREHKIAKSLTDCDLLAESIRTYCHDGVFMEFSISAPPKFYRESDPIYPCNDIVETYKGSCARSQVQVMRLRMGFDTQNIATACLKTENDKIIYHCIDALGYFIGQRSQGAADSIISGCNEIGQVGASAQCLAAAAGELVFQDMRGWQEATEQVCQSLAGEYRSACEKRVSEVKQSYGRD